MLPNTSRISSAQAVSRAKRHTFFAWLLCLFLAALPWAVGLNRPWAWGGFCVVTFGLMCTHVALFKHASWLPVFRWPLVWFGLFFGWAVVQCVPHLSRHSVWQLTEQTLGPNADIARTIAFHPQPNVLLLLLAYAGCLWLGAQIKQPKYMVATTVATVCAACLLACWAVAFPMPTWWQINRLDYLQDATLPFLNRNALASYITIGLLLAISYAPRFLTWPQKNKKKRVYLTDDFPQTAAYMLLLVFLSFTLFLTHSRAGLFCAGVGVVALWWLRGWRYRKSLMLGCLGAGVLACIMPILSDRIALLPEDFARRVNIWQASWQVAKSCWPTGCGLGNFTEAYRLLGDATGSFRTIDKAHNIVLHLLVTMGAAAVCVPLMCLPLLRCIWPKKKQRAHPLEGAVCAICLSLILHNMVDFSLHMPAILATLCLLLGAALGRKSLTKEALKKESHSCVILP